MKNIKMKNFEIKNIVEVLASKDSILNFDDKDRKISFNILWNIDTNFRILFDIAKRVNGTLEKIENKYSDNEHSTAIINENGDEIGRNVKDEYINSINMERYELMNVDNEISISTISLSELSNYNLTGKEFQSIRFMIEEEEDDKK